MFGQPRDDMRVADYVLGLMEPDEARYFERELRQDAALAARVNDWRARVAQFEQVDPATPQAEMRRRIEEGLRRRPPRTAASSDATSPSKGPARRVPGILAMASGYFVAGILLGGMVTWIFFGG